MICVDKLAMSLSDGTKTSPINKNNQQKQQQTKYNIAI